MSIPITIQDVEKAIKKLWLKKTTLLDRFITVSPLILKESIAQMFYKLV